jgi:hypothetical protein
MTGGSFPHGAPMPPSSVASSRNNAGAGRSAMDMDLKHFFLARTAQFVPQVKPDMDRCGCYPSVTLPPGGIR